MHVYTSHAYKRIIHLKYFKIDENKNKLNLSMSIYYLLLL